MREFIEVTATTGNDNGEVRALILFTDKIEGVILHKVPSSGRTSVSVMMASGNTIGVVMNQELRDYLAASGYLKNWDQARERSF